MLLIGFKTNPHAFNLLKLIILSKKFVKNLNDIKMITLLSSTLNSIRDLLFLEEHAY